MKILFVDDETEYTSILGEWFAARGHDVHIAADATAIPHLFRLHHYDVVSLDLMMPGSNGMSWIEWIRTTSPETAVVVVSALTDLQVAKLAVREGANDCVAKPIDLADLEQRLSWAAEESGNGKVSR